MLSKLSRRSVNHIRAAGYFVTASRVSSALLKSHPRAFSTGAAQPAENHEFKAETRKLLDIVARSLYTDKEVFIRELVSNSSDALEKFRFLSSTHQIKNVLSPDTSLGITVEVNETERTFTIVDTGIGMSRAELIENLGTIARSGSKKFIEEVGSSDNKIIGQFGVGFYSSFVVADKVKVYSRSADVDKDEHGYCWESDGMGTFSVTRDDSISRGTRIEIHLKEEAVDFSKYEVVKSAATKFSSFIDFPLKIRNCVSNDETEITQQEALWLKTSATQEEHADFYRFLSGQSYGDPIYSFFFHTDAPLSIKSVFYMPEDAPDRFFNAHSIPQSGVALHSRRVMVTKHADKIIPQWLYWVKGVVDCEDMPLNISRENMQDSALLTKLSNVVVKRILRFLIDESKKNPEKFAKFYKNYATFLKAGLLEDVRVHGGSLHKEQLMKLLRFELVQDESSKLISLQEYVDMIKDTDQKNIYYINAPSKKSAQISPYMDGLAGVPVLLLTDDIDDFVVNSVGPFGGKTFVSIDSGEVDRKPTDSTAASFTDAEKATITDLFKTAIGDKKIAEIIFSENLVSCPAVVTSQLSPHMRKMMKNLIAQTASSAPSDEDVFDAMPVKLELSQSHELIRSLLEISDADETVKKIVPAQIYYNAMLSAGMIDDARAVLPTITDLVRVCIKQAVAARTQ